jgi:hypothetical protein
MTNVTIGPVTLLDPTPEEEACFRYAMSVLRPDVSAALPSLIKPHTLDFTVDIPGTQAVPRPEGLYPGGKLIKVRPLRRRGKLQQDRVAGTCLHEMVHGFRFTPVQKQAFIKLFGATKWKDPSYWDSVNESVCYRATRILTDGKLVSKYEDDLDLDWSASLEDEYLAILLGQGATTPDEPEPAPPTPGPDPELVLLRAAVATLTGELATANRRIKDKDAKAQELLLL